MSQSNFTIDVTASVVVPQMDTAASLALLPQTTVTADGNTYIGVTGTPA